MRGVHLSNGKWQATIGRSCSPTFINLGSFLRYEDAVAARRAAEVTRFGYVHDSEDSVIDGNLARIPVFNRTGKRVAYASVDLVDLPKVAGSRWCMSHGYAVSRKNKEMVRMHKVICPGICTDHIDRDTMNNTRRNLRECSVSDNNCNSRLRSHNKSGFKGVCFCKVKNKWRVTIKTKTKQVHVGYFSDLNKAAQAYDAASRKLHGAFSVTNADLGLYGGE